MLRGAGASMACTPEWFMVRGWYSRGDLHPRGP